VKERCAGIERRPTPFGANFVRDRMLWPQDLKLGIKKGVVFVNLVYVYQSETS
jgi:hypothetical protein